MQIRNLYAPTFSAFLFLALGSIVAKADTCGSVPNNFIQNCGFEKGVYTDTMNGSTNPSVPNSWTPSAGYDLNPSFNSVTTIANSGSYGLSIGNYENQPVPMLSQTFSDLAGGSYSGQIYVEYGPGSNNNDPGAFFNVQINGNNALSLNQTASSSYALYNFNFTGTGSDTLSLGGNLTHSEWYVDDVSVTGPAVTTMPPSPGVTPEPSSIALFGTGLVSVGGLMRRRFLQK